MIKVNELRVGNYVSDIHAGVLFYSSVVKLDYSKCYYGGFNSSYSDLIPIPLTEEWLLKFGFIEINEFSIAKTYCLVIDGIIKYKIHKGIDLDYFVMPNEYNPIKFKYVHQLQNLHFALTGQELTIK